MFGSSRIKPAPRELEYLYIIDALPSSSNRIS